jgi:hypothetical protein
MIARGTRGAWRVAAFLALAASLSTPLAAQEPVERIDRRPAWRGDLGVAVSTPLLEDGNGVSVRRGPGPVVSGEAVMAIDARSALVITLRAASAPLRARSSGRQWSAGDSRQIDVGMRLERRAPGGTIVGLGLAASRLTGPVDLVPFRGESGAILTWGTEVTLSRRLSSQGPLHALVATDVIRLPRQGTANPSVHAGWVGRVRLALRYAR